MNPDRAAIYRLPLGIDNEHLPVGLEDHVPDSSTSVKELHWGNVTVSDDLINTNHNVVRHGAECQVSQKCHHSAHEFVAYQNQVIYTTLMTVMGSCIGCCIPHCDLDIVKKVDAELNSEHLGTKAVKAGGAFYERTSSSQSTRPKELVRPSISGENALSTPIVKPVSSVLSICSMLQELACCENVCDEGHGRDI